MLKILGQAFARCLARADVVQKPEMDAAIQALSEQIASTFNALGSRLDSEASIKNDNHEAVLAAIKSAVSQIDAASIARERAFIDRVEASESAAIDREAARYAGEQAAIARVEASIQAAIARVEASETAAIAREEASGQAVIARVEASERAAIAREVARDRTAITREDAASNSVDTSFNQLETIWTNRHRDLADHFERTRIERALQNEACHADASVERKQIANETLGAIHCLQRKVETRKVEVDSLAVKVYELQTVRDGDKELQRSNIAKPFKDLVDVLKTQNMDPQLQGDRLERLKDTWDSVHAFIETSPEKSRGWSSNPSRAGSSAASGAASDAGSDTARSRGQSRGHSPVMQ